MSLLICVTHCSNQLTIYFLLILQYLNKKCDYQDTLLHQFFKSEQCTRLFHRSTWHTNIFYFFFYTPLFFLYCYVRFHKDLTSIGFVKGPGSVCYFKIQVFQVPQILSSNLNILALNRCLLNVSLVFLSILILFYLFWSFFEL